MKKIITSAIIFFGAIATIFAQKNLPALGSRDINIFDNSKIIFSPKKYHDGFNAADSFGVIHLVNGRIILKKVNLPKYKRDVKIFATITLKSNGDRWDKSGSCFIIPSESPINMMTIAKGETRYPTIDSAKLENLNGVIAGKNYKPTIEIMRFMTPFGVGFYNESSQKRKPVYIDSWAKNITWKQDITDLSSRLEGETYIGIFVDTWTEEGYIVNMDLNFEEAKSSCFAIKKQHVEPIINTVYYMGQSYPDIFNRKNIDVFVDIPKKASNIKLKYIVTGHGGHSGGDEFTKRKNIIYLDDKELFKCTPWRNDCASFRRFNPSTGVWLVKRTASFIGEKGYEEKEIEEPLASSDLSRSNWCPGSDVQPYIVEIRNIKSGIHKITFSIPEAAKIDGEKMNHWLISAYLVWNE